MIRFQASATYKCSAERDCSQTDVIRTSSSMFNRQGKCSALLTREGFFDFVVFKTECTISHNTVVVCQHDQDVNVTFSNNMSDIKVSTVDGLYSLQVFSSCDVGWFLVDNVCINFYHCPGCTSNTAAHEQCEEHGGQLAYNILNNMTIDNTPVGYKLDKNTKLSLFWQMFLHTEDINPGVRDSFENELLFYHSPQCWHHFAVNGTGLCLAFDMGRQCIDNDVALTLDCFDITVIEDYFPHRALGPDKRRYTRNTRLKREDNSHYSQVQPWTVIDEIYFEVIGSNRHFTLCEKSVMANVILTNCSDLYMVCNDGTCVHDSLVCDGQLHCLHGEDEADCQHICSDHKHSCMSQCHHRDLCTCSPAYFQCLSGGCVPLQKLSDKTVHCVDSSDEPNTCVYIRPEQLGHPSLSLDINNFINKLIQQNIAIQQRCLQSSTELILPLHNVAYEVRSHQQRRSPSGLSSEVTFLCSYIKIGRSSFDKYFQTIEMLDRFALDRLCIYDRDCDDSCTYQCSNGFHLLKCEHMHCVGRFKCPASYCISFDHICDKVCDCPHCEDERICNKLLCPGTVLVDQMGSGLKCSMNMAGLKYSENMRQVIQRKNMNLSDDFPVLIHLEGVMNFTSFIRTPEVVVYCQIQYSTFVSTDVNVLHHMISVRRLLLTHNNIQTLYDTMFVSMSELILLDLSHNLIIYFPPITMCSLHNLRYISLHHNLIAEFQISIFINNPSLQVLLLESNDLSPQSVAIDGSLPSLNRLSSDIPRLCCAFETASSCSPPFPLFVSCSNMITSKVLVVLGWLIGLVTSLLSLFCLSFLLYKLCTPTKQTSKVVMLFSLNLSLAELVTSLCLLSYSVINVIFQDVFGIIADQWRYSWMCLGLEILFSLSSRSSLTFAACLSVLFAIHIPSALRREPSQKATIFQIISTWLIIAFISTAVQIVEYMHTFDPFNYFCFPFTTLFPSDPLILSFQIVMLILDSLLGMVTIVSCSYLLMFSIRRRKNEALQHVGKSKKNLQKLGIRLTVVILSTILTWIPILSVQVLVLSQIAIWPTIYF